MEKLRNWRFTYHFKKASQYSFYSHLKGISPQQQLKYQRKASKHLAKGNRTWRNIKYCFDYQGSIEVDCSRWKTMWDY